MAEWARLSATTIADYMKGVEDKLMAKRILLAAIKKEGGMVYNCGGDGFNWAVEYNLPPLQTDDAETPITPTRRDAYKRAALDYIGYRLDDQVTKREKLKNKGPGQLVDYMKEIGERMGRAAKEKFPEELYVDSSATGNSARITGIESMFAINGTVDLTATSVASRAANDGDLVAYPSDTYAGLSTVLGNYGGSWTVGTAGADFQWPNGAGDMRFDFFSPILVHYNSTAFSPTTHDWNNQCVEATRFMIIGMNRYVSDRGSLKMVLLHRHKYFQYLNKLDSKERINTTSNMGLRALGFEDTFVQDGVDITWEHGIPANVGYGLNASQMEIRSCQDRLFVTDGPWYERLQRSYVIVTDFFGQMKCHSPRFFGKLADFV